MKYYVIINGNSSLNIQGLAIESLPNISKPLIRTSREEIDGRDGDIITKLGYSAYDKTLNIGLWGNYDINEVIAFFNQEGVITFSNEPDKYYKFTIVNRIDFVNELEKFKKASITIHCQPFKYQEQPEVVAEEEGVELTGTSFNITDSLEAPLLMDLKGNTSQNTLSGKNLCNGINQNIWISGSYDLVGIGTSNSGLIIPANGGYYTISTTETQSRYRACCVDTLPTSRQNVPGYNGVLYDNTKRVITINTSGHNYLVVDATNLTKIQIEVGQTATSYEPYCGGVPSPNPTYPQNVNVVSGDNDIVVCGKNLVDVNNSVYGAILVNDTTGALDAVSAHQAITSEWILCKPNTTYRISGQNNRTRWQTKDKNGIITYIIDQKNTITTNSTAKYMRVYYYYNDEPIQDISSIKIQIEEGSTATTYEPYNGTTYNIDLPVENLLDLSNISWYRNNNSDYSVIVDNSTTRVKSSLIEINGGTYTISGIPSVLTMNTGSPYCYDSNKTYLGNAYATFTNGVITLPSNVKYIVLVLNGTNLNDSIKTILSNSNLQLEQGLKSNAYTPYGTTPIELCKIGTYQDYIYKEDDKWYLHKEVGKVVLNGTETNITRPSDNRFNIDNVINNYLKINGITYICDKYVAFNQTGGNSDFNNLVSNVDYGFNFGSSTAFNIRFKDIRYNTADDFKTYLSNNNVIIYYILANATNTEITYQPLLNQLNALENAESYEGTTNINQVNNDLPFILGLTYFTGDNTITITNDGNIYSKPLLRIKGTSDISISLNGIQIFQITLQNNEIIIIDTEKMEAYYDGILKNRQVIGDYNNFKLNPGENTIEINGAFDYVRISRYSRWV